MAGGGVLKRIIEKVVVLEGGRGVKCVVMREGEGGEGSDVNARLLRVQASRFWMFRW